MNNELEKRACDYCSIAAAEIEDIRDSRDKWKRVAVAREHAIKMQYNSSSEGLLAHREMLAAIADLGDEWTEAVK